MHRFRIRLSARKYIHVCTDIVWACELTFTASWRYLYAQSLANLFAACGLCYKDCSVSSCGEMKTKAAVRLSLILKNAPNIIPQSWPESPCVLQPFPVAEFLSWQVLNWMPAERSLGHYEWKQGSWQKSFGQGCARKAPGLKRSFGLAEVGSHRNAQSLRHLICLGKSPWSFPYLVQ